DEEPEIEEVVEEEELTEVDEAFEALETVDDTPAEEEEAIEDAEIPVADSDDLTELEQELIEEDSDFNLDHTAFRIGEDETEEEIVLEEEPREELEDTQETEPPAYVYKHAAQEKFAENVDEEIPEYTVPDEEDTGPVLVEDDPVIIEDENTDPDLEELPREVEELPDIVSGAIDVVDGYDDRVPEVSTDDDDVLDSLIDEAEKTLDIPIVGFRKED
ncbi:MAG: hypothetical protein Q4B44_02550, partial [Erysipelotrichaceae bacterium]|nr:hypothetical protein [Erysipelotrichaceae bacterium]